MQRGSDETTGRGTKQVGARDPAAFDEAERGTDGPQEASRAASDALALLLRRIRSTSDAPKLLMPPRGHRS